MTQYDFIFSHQRQHRIARHVAFWLVWLFFYLLLFHYPVHAIKGWNLNEASKNLQKLGTLKFVVKTIVFNSFLCVIVPHATFTYVLLYWFLPGYFYKKSNPVVTLCVIAAFLLLSLLVFASFRILNPVGDYLFGASKSILAGMNFKLAFYIAAVDILTNLPIVAGFAVMIKLIKRWWIKQKETAQLANEKTRAELQLLKAQVHPHFLFNTLNNIYYFTLSGSPKAPEMINKLSGLLHYIINECNQPMVPLQKEINMVRDYMSLEKIRYGDQMKMSFEIRDASDTLQKDMNRILIAPLLLIPFVENCFKHGTSKVIAHPWVKLSITIENMMLHFCISNSRPHEAEPQLRKGNIGLKNVKQRLQLLYPDSHELDIISEPESFTVVLRLLLKDSEKTIANDDLKTTAAYAMA